MHSPPASALIVPVPVAEPLIAPWRTSYDPSANQGVPAHITLLYPFVEPDLIDASVLERIDQIAAVTKPFRFRLNRTERYPALLVLPPEPATGFVELRERLLTAWPEIVPYGGRYGDRPPPHVTVAWSELHKPGGCPDFAPLEDALAAELPIGGGATEMTLLVRREDRWSVLARFALAG